MSLVRKGWWVFEASYNVHEINTASYQTRKGRGKVRQDNGRDDDRYGYSETIMLKSHDHYYYYYADDSADSSEDDNLDEDDMYIRMHTMQ